MNSSIKAQMDIKNSAEDMQRFFSEMKTWEKEIKEKEQKLTGVTALQAESFPPPRNVSKKKHSERHPPSDPAGKETKRISAYDYRSWDQFDVEQACKEIDKESDDSDQSVSDHGSDSDMPPVKRKSPVRSEEKLQTSKTSSEPPEIPESVDLHQKAKDAQKLQNIDLAYFEKELGNKFVKDQKWEDAIECYTRAIQLDPSSPIYYANRALCHIKLSKFKEAEVDSTVALQLDRSYVKAYQRRAFARKALQQYIDAKSDYKQVLLLEPNNSLVQGEIAKIDGYLEKTGQSSEKKEFKSTFDPRKVFDSPGKTKKHSKSKEQAKTSKEDQSQMENKDGKILKPLPPEDQKPEKSPEKNQEEKGVDKEIKSSFKNPLPHNYVSVKPVVKPPHLRSKKMLKKINIKHVEICSGVECLLASGSPEMPRAVVPPLEVDAKVRSCLLATPSDSQCDQIKLPPVPKTCVQFQLAWKSVSAHKEICYRFLKSIPCKSLASIFGSSMENWLMSQLFSTLASCLDDPELLFEWLAALTTVDRFNSLVLFMSTQDEKELETCFTRLAEVHSAQEIAQLRTLYGLS